MVAFLAFAHRLLPWLGLAAIPLAGLLAVQTIDANRWHRQADHFEQLYSGEKIAHQQTIINYQNAANKARADDLANKKRVEREQAAINDERTKAYEARLADARARADRLRHELEAASHPSGPGKSPMPGVPNAAGGVGKAAPQGELPLEDRLTATEQAIQLDELIKWVKGIGRIDTNGKQ